MGRSFFRSLAGGVVFGVMAAGPLAPLVRPTSRLALMALAPPPTFVTKWGSPLPTSNGQFGDPEGVAVDSKGNIYVVDGFSNRIEKFSSNGVFIMSWGAHGSGNGQFEFPIYASVDSSDNVYVADSGNSRIQKFTAAGAFISSFGSPGSGDGQFQSPEGVAID